MLQHPSFTADQVGSAALLVRKNVVNRTMDVTVPLLHYGKPDTLMKPEKDKAQEGTLTRSQ